MSRLSQINVIVLITFIWFCKSYIRAEMIDAKFNRESSLNDATVDNVAAANEHHRIILLVPQSPQFQQVKKKGPKIHHSKVIPVVHSGKIIHAHHHHGKAEHGHSHDLKAKHHHDHVGKGYHKHNHYGTGTIKHTHGGKSPHHHHHHHKHASPRFINSNEGTQNAMNAFFLQRYLEASARQDSGDSSAKLIRIHVPSFEGHSPQDAEFNAESDLDVFSDPVNHLAKSLQTPYDSHEPNALNSDENEEAAVPYPVFSYPLSSSENNVIAHSGVYHYQY